MFFVLLVLAPNELIFLLILYDLLVDNVRKFDDVRVFAVFKWVLRIEVFAPVFP